MNQRERRVRFKRQLARLDPQAVEVLIRLMRRLRKRQERVWARYDLPRYWLPPVVIGAA